MTKKNLQIITVILALLPISTGIIGLLGIYDPIYHNALYSSPIVVDSNLRFFSGLWLGIGIYTLTIIKTIEQQTQVFRILWGCIFLGGLGRVLSMIVAGYPPSPFIVFTLLEVLGAPLFIYWQQKISTKLSQ